MNKKTRLTALLLSVLMLVMPVASVAEEAIGFSAGDLTGTAIAESYAAGMQLNVSAGFAIELEESMTDARAQALASLLSKSTLNLSFYDDFGTARIRAALVTDGVELATADALVFEDGSAQIMTSLTGKYVMTVPAGAFAGQSLDELMGIEVGSEEFNALDIKDRLKIMAIDANSTFLNLLLGWVSSTQMETGELYTFDNEPLEATPTRDAVAQRMIGKISTYDFMYFLWNVVSAFRDDQGPMLQATADILAELGVTRYQARQVIDALLTEETIDPATDFVQTSWSVQDDGSLCELGDVQYFMRKLEKSVDNLSYLSTDLPMSMIVSYDENGQMVGFDADVPLITEGWPFEGSFVYSIRTDEHAQRLHTSHGELQVSEEDRLVGDLNIQFGQDIGGVKQSGFSGTLDLNGKDGGVKGIGISAGLTSQVEAGESGESIETFEGELAFSRHDDGENADALTAVITGETVLTDDALTLNAEASLQAAGLAGALVSLTMEQSEFDEAVFEGGVAVDVTNLSDEELGTLKSEIALQAAKVSLALIPHPGVLADLMTLIGK